MPADFSFASVEIRQLGCHIWPTFRKSNVQELWDIAYKYAKPPLHVAIFIVCVLEEYSVIKPYPVVIIC